MVSDTPSLIVNGNAPFFGAFFCVFCKNERQCSVFQAVSKPFFTSKEGGLNRLDWVGMLRFRQACSTEQNTMEQVRMSDVVSFGCTSSFSATESRPEYYEAEMAKPTLMLISVDAKGVAHFNVKDLQANCAVTGFRPQVSSQDREIRIVLVPLGDPTLEADCMCKFDVSFNLSNLTSDAYHVAVYSSDFSGKYDSIKPLYQGSISFLPNKSIEVELK